MARAAYRRQNMRRSATLRTSADSLFCVLSRERFTKFIALFPEKLAELRTMAQATNTATHTRLCMIPAAAPFSEGIGTGGNGRGGKGQGQRRGGVCFVGDVGSGVFLPMAGAGIVAAQAAADLLEYVRVIAPSDRLG
jgi:hypothetical protein